MKAQAVIVIFIVLAVYIFSSPNWGKKVHTIYSIYCENDSCEYTDKPFVSKTTYLAMPETQIVVGLSNEFPTTYKNCEVFNAENWLCKSNENKQIYDLIMNHGRFMQLDLDEETMNKTRRISRIEYTFTILKRFFTGKNKFKSQN